MFGQLYWQTQHGSVFRDQERDVTQFPHFYLGIIENRNLYKVF